MKKEIINNDIKVRNGVQSFDVDFTPETSAISRASFFKINTGLLQTVGFKPFALYIKLKSLYSNSTIYNYSPRKISELSGLSVFLVKKNLLILEKFGLITYRNNNLTLRSQRHFENKYKGKTKLFIGNKTFKEISELLLLELIKRKQKQQIHAKIKVIRKDRNKRETLSKKLLMGEICDNDKIIGLRSLSKQLNVSASFLCNFINKMKKQRRITVKHIKQNLGNIPVFNNYCESGYMYKNKKGNTILFFGSVYSFS